MVLTSDKSVSMQKWGIPSDDMVDPEVTLLERLVWVPYEGHWWPALLYKDYTELQDHLYNELDVISKAQFATAIMRQLNNPRQIKIARLLGRQVLEVVEVGEKEFAEFYWQLPKVLPMACLKSNYGNDTNLYLDFHRALDQVEEIIRDISKNSFNLFSSGDKKTWVQRAEEALEYPHATSSITDGASMMKRKEATDAAEYNFMFAALDGMMEQCNSTYDCVSGKVEEKIVEEPERGDVAPWITKQKETRNSLRKALARQRKLRESGSLAATNQCVVSDETRNLSIVDNNSLGAVRSSSVVRSPSTEVLPASSGDDTVLWKLLNFKEEDKAEAEAKRPATIPRDPSQSMQDPELVALAPKKTLVQPAQGYTFNNAQEPIDAREENPEGDRNAVMAAARAAAAVELEVTFWDHLTCNAMEH
jgi:hypothetical protein